MRPKRAKRIQGTLLNVTTALRTWPEFHTGRMFRLDTFSGETVIAKALLRPGIDPPSYWDPLTVCTDIHVTWALELLEECGMQKVGRSTADAAIDAEADRNSFSAVRELVESLPAWDGIERLDKFWVEVTGAAGVSDGMDEDELYKRIRYLYATARCFFISIIARIMQPGAKVDTVVVLEGPQGALKSTLLRAIAFDKDQWFSDSMVADLKNKDARAHLAGKLVVELAELSQMRSTRQLETIKAFISAQDDKFRPAYGRREKSHKRQNVFVGTTNDASYLTDLTGNRRFWPIPCGKIDITKARDWMPQLYAEALQALRMASGGGCRKRSRAMRSWSRKTAARSTRWKSSSRAKWRSGGRPREAAAIKASSSRRWNCCVKPKVVAQPGLSRRPTQRSVESWQN